MRITLSTWTTPPPFPTPLTPPWTSSHPHPQIPPPPPGPVQQPHGTRPGRSLPPRTSPPLLWPPPPSHPWTSPPPPHPWTSLPPPGSTAAGQATIPAGALKFRRSKTTISPSIVQPPWWNLSQCSSSSSSYAVLWVLLSGTCAGRCRPRRKWRPVAEADLHSVRLPRLTPTLSTRAVTADL